MALSSLAPVLGSLAPDFRLRAANPEASGGSHVSRSDMSGARVLLVVFTCNHCPYAVAVEDRLIALAEAYAPEGLQAVVISSNDAEAYPADSFENMAVRAEQKGYPFPYLYDETQEVARAFGAVCTPEFFLYDADLRLVYAGRLNDGRPTRPGRPGTEPTTRDLADAIEQTLAGQAVSAEQIPSMGCGIKWREQE
ncbi:thioredoxin family protein [Rubricoccus marinus]|uniref:Thioredoxin domain-containing protein n=1 Tax=Rubricoccus marinus TaxID=716817 RepID=A0A259TWS6_9BACT|nr:thioredoxin family protein [Rubricoccus marinus]OZC02150.1 hypothetical protein BSZ36_03605 [Rubricoccus marinus]